MSTNTIHLGHEPFKISAYNKAIVAAIATGINFAAGLISDGEWSAEDTGNLILWLGTTLGVWGATNSPQPRRVEGGAPIPSGE